MNMAVSQTGDSFQMLSSKYDNIELTSRILPFGHSPETGICVVCINCNYTVTSYLNSVNGYSETGTNGSRSGPGFLLLIYNEHSENLITPYLMARETNIGYWTDDENAGVGY